MYKERAVLDLERISKLLEDHRGVWDVPIEPFDIGGVHLDFAHRRYLMGVVNLSTDSRNKDTVCYTPEAAFRRGQQLIRDGAHIVDVGAESTRLDNERISPRAQIDRLLPVVEHYTQHGILTSIDTYYPEVFEACAKAGARIFNLTGTRDADAAFELVARYEAAVVICYVQGDTPRDHGDFVKYDDMVPAMIDYFAALLERARRLGVSRCIIDPGLGFHYRNLSDSSAQLRFQLEILISTFRFRQLGCPTLNVLPWAPSIFGGLGKEAEALCAPIGFMGGTHIIRTHVVKQAAQVLRMLETYGVADGSDPKR